MAEIVKADIFFFITTIAVTIVTVGFILVIYYLVKVIQEVRSVVRVVDEEIESLISKRRKFRLQILTIEKVLGGFAKRIVPFGNRRKSKDG